MRCVSHAWAEGRGWSNGLPATHDADLVLYFGSHDALASGERHGELQAAHPSALILGCTTGGQIRGIELELDGVAAVALHFDATKLRLATERVDAPGETERCGRALGLALAAPDLAAVFVLSDGLQVNGSRLVEGLTGAVGSHVPVTGGLAGDGARFGVTLVGAGSHKPESRRIAALGFYGSRIRVGHGSAGGWSPFGPRRRITRAEGNVLIELDGEPALDLYERYLGEEAEGLPGTGLLFPLRIWNPARPEHDAVRTVLAVDRGRRTMTFAGDMREGYGAQLMRAEFEQLVAGAAQAATQAGAASAESEQRLAILVSCIGRRLLMGQTSEDEIEAACGALGSNTTSIGFYSYGEIAPHAASGFCELHNQTMTVTTLAELAA